MFESIEASGPVIAIGVTEIGSYAGFAAILGLAVLSALYFSQARDVKRLRDWAGRAPERDAEARARVAAATAAGQARQEPAAQPAAGNSQPTAPKVPAVGPGGATPVGARTAAAATGGHGGVASPARPLQRPSGQTALLDAQERPRERWYRRIAPRYIALIVAGVLVVGGGIAVGVVQLVSGSERAGSGEQSAQVGAQPESGNAAPQPGDVSVAVLNATGINGLANQFGDKAQAEGFRKDNVGNAPGGQRAESIVLYAPGQEAAARLVRRRFDVSNMEPVDPESQGLAPQADVILIIGSDKTQ